MITRSSSPHLAAIANQSPGAPIEDLRALLTNVTAAVANASAELSVLAPLVVAAQEAAVVQPVLLTTEQAAEALSISRTGVYGLLRSGQLRSVKLGGARRIPVVAIEAFVRSLDQRHDELARADQ